MRTGGVLTTSLPYIFIEISTNIFARLFPRRKIFSAVIKSRTRKIEDTKNGNYQMQDSRQSRKITKQREIFQDEDMARSNPLPGKEYDENGEKRCPRQFCRKPVVAESERI